MNHTKPATRQQGTQRPARNAAGEMPIPVFYSPAMVADGQCFSPSAGKPALVVKSWQMLGLPLDIRAPQPVSQEQFGVAHDPGFVADVLACRRNNGFSNKCRRWPPPCHGPVAPCCRPPARRWTTALAPSRRAPASIMPAMTMPVVSVPLTA
jgi:hypothetical protein